LFDLNASGAKQGYRSRSDISSKTPKAALAAEALKLAPDGAEMKYLEKEKYAVYTNRKRPITEGRTLLRPLLQTDGRPRPDDHGTDR
jgi:hypothetical protein